MASRAHAMKYIRRLIRGKVYFFNQVVKNTKFQLNFCTIMPATPKMHLDMGCEYHLSKERIFQVSLI